MVVLFLCTKSDNLYHCTTSLYLYILVYVMTQLSQNLQAFYRNTHIALVTNIFVLTFLIITI